MFCLKIIKSKFLLFFVIFSMLINILMLNTNQVSANTSYSSSGEISGYIWFDYNGNGKWESNNWHENIISGVKVDLCDENNQVLQSTNTTYYGQYFFKGLSWGSYRVKVHLPSGYTFTSPGNGNGVQYRISKADPSTGITDIIYPTSRYVNIGLIKGQSTDNTDTPTNTPVQGSLMDINRTIDKQSVTVGETFDVKYTINPKPVLTQQDATQKDIVLVIDTSGSMAYAPSAKSYTSKLETIKTVATSFVSSFETKANVNISLVKFDNKAYSCVPLTNMKNGYYNNLYSQISVLEASGSTNIGDGLRIAYNQLNNNNGHDKYIVFMTDGGAEAYSYNQGYVMGTESSYNVYSTLWDYYHRYANPDYRVQSLEYAKKVASEKIANSNIKSFFIGFGTDANSNNVQIAEAAKGTYQSAIDSTTVTKVYNEIQKQIDTTINGTAAFQETFNSNLEVDTASLPDGLKAENNKVTGNINIQYTLNDAKTQYEHNDPVEFIVKYKVKAKADCILGQGGNSSSVKLDVSSKTETKFLPEKTMSVIDGTSNTDSIMNISRTVDVPSVKVGDTFEAAYNISPNSISVQQDNTQKDIVLVVDTSTSMDDAPNSSSQSSKLEIIKSVAENFVSKFSNKDNVNIAVVDFNSLAKQDKGITNMGTSTAQDDLNNAIDNFKTGSNTNIGDGLRKAYYMLNNNNGHDKYVIFMTDGAANTYSVNGNWSGNGDSDWQWQWNQAAQRFENYGRYIQGNYGGWKYCYPGSYYWNYYMDSNDPTQFACFGNEDPNGLTYAKKIASEKFANSNIKSFIIGFGSEANSSNQQIADAAKGIYQAAGDETAVNGIYDNIQKQINSTIHGNAAFQETFSSNLEVDTSTLPQGLKVDGNKITGNIGVEYALDSGKTQYIAEPIQFKVKYKVNANSDCILGQGGNTSPVLLTASDKSETKYFPELVIPTVVDGTTSSLPEVNINVTDGTGNVDTYVASSSNTTKRVDKFLPGETKLKGDAYANISFKGEDADIFQYKIIPYSTDPKDVNIDNLTDWNTLDLQQQKVNNDVITDKQGYLNQRAYDVSDLPNLTDTVSWSNPDLVFKKPFAATAYKAATYSQDAASYGKWEDYIKDDGTKGKRWVTNSIFLPDMFISNDYKEASKFWGYIKVPSDGNYYFGAISDDGCRGYITVDGETKTFVDMFKAQGATPGTTGNVFNLKANTYYPIYLEYSNWGGSAAFELRYSNSSMNLSTVTSDPRIPSEWFYPSKTLSPGEYTKTVFTGSAGVKLPKDPGDYYIAYRTGKKDDSGNIQRVDREGFYGGFTVEKKADLDLKREIANNNFNVGDVIEIKYTITPHPITVTEVYPDGNGPDTYTNTVSDFKYQDVFPQGIKPISKDDASTVINEQKISIKLPDNITYTKNGTEYKANPITFSVYAQLDASGNYILKGEDSIITYTDIDGAARQLNFNNLNINGQGDSNILKQGIYEKNNTKYQYIKNKQDINADLRIVEKMSTDLGMIVDIKTSNPKINLNISGNYTQGNITFDKYELKQDGTINKAVPTQTITLDSSKLEINSSDTFKMEAGKKYLIIYSITPNGKKDDTITVQASVDNNTADTMNLKIDELPIVQ